MARTKTKGRESIRKRTFVVVYTLDDEEGGYAVHIPSLGIVTQGSTLDEARIMARDAINVYIAAAQHLGRRIPDDAAVIEQVMCALG